MKMVVKIHYQIICSAFQGTSFLDGYPETLGVSLLIAKSKCSKKLLREAREESQGCMMKKETLSASKDFL